MSHTYTPICHLNRKLIVGCVFYQLSALTGVKGAMMINKIRRFIKFGIVGEKTATEQAVLLVEANKKLRDLRGEVNAAKILREKAEFREYGYREEVFSLHNEIATRDQKIYSLNEELDRQDREFEAKLKEKEELFIGKTVKKLIKSVGVGS
jgi:hypothetical protein